MSELLISNVTYDGGYAEQPAKTQDWFDQMGHVLSGQAKNWFFSNRKISDFVNNVNQCETQLKTFSNEFLVKRIKEKRKTILVEGFTPEIMAECFAIVREMANRVLGLRHYDVQLMGGWVLLNGKVAEMETGEGKTLTATLPACTMALTGIPVHIITVNDYLAKRDAEQMKPLYEAFGFSVGLIQEGMSVEQRKKEYACDITYCTNKELIFDYLKDRITIGNQSGYIKLKMENIFSEKSRVDNLILRGLCFGIVDEADSVLVDEARVPAIISSASKNSAEEESITKAYEIAMMLDKDIDYQVTVNKHIVEFTEQGLDHLSELTDLLSGIWQRKKWREEMVRQALTAKYTYFKDKHYIVRDEKIQIIDEYTGRAMPDRSWERGLHQMVELKESIPVTSQKEPVARMSYQRFYRRYLRLAGMTGTAKEISSELSRVYSLDVVKIPTNRQVRRKTQPCQILVSSEQKWQCIVNNIKELNKKGCPVLVGTRTVEASEHLSDLLTQNNLTHKVLNARQDKEEAEIILAAGQAGQITVATNMAGRGTDIGINKDVINKGGLYVLATEKNESKRIDRQLYGRCARQGDPGSCIDILSLEDEIIKTHVPAVVLEFTATLLNKNNKFGTLLGKLLFRYSQKRTEWLYSGIRLDLLKRDQKLSDFLAFAGYKE